MHYGADTDNVVNSSDVWFVYVYNEKWQQVATYRATDSSGLIGTIDGSPKQVFVWHMAGMDGRGGSSYIDSMIVEKRDAFTNWNAAADGLDSDKFAVQNWRRDMIAILDSSTRRVQGARFAPMGMPKGLPRTDVDGDGDVDAVDQGIINTASGGSYDVRADINLDGAVNSTDQAYYTSDQGTTLGYGAFSLGADHAQGGGHRWSFTGRERSYVTDKTVFMRNRALRADLGVWTRRDPLGYVDGPNLYGYVLGPIGGTDPMGLVVWAPGTCIPPSWGPVAGVRGSLDETNGPQTYGPIDFGEHPSSSCTGCAGGPKANPAKQAGTIDPEGFFKCTTYCENSYPSDPGMEDACLAGCLAAFRSEYQSQGCSAFCEAHFDIPEQIEACKAACRRFRGGKGADWCKHKQTACYGQCRAIRKSCMREVRGLQGGGAALVLVGGLLILGSGGTAAPFVCLGFTALGTAAVTVGSMHDAELCDDIKAACDAHCDCEHDACIGEMRISSCTQLDPYIHLFDGGWFKAPLPDFYNPPSYFK